jgi:hypothetical protein
VLNINHMSLRLIPSQLLNSDTTKPYARLLNVRLQSGQCYLLSSELWNLLPSDDPVVSVVNANNRPIFAPVERIEPPVGSLSRS